MYVRRTLKELGTLAVSEVGFCVGIYWRSVKGRLVPQGMISPNYRLAYVLFSGYAPAYRFHTLLTRTGVERLPRRRVRLVELDHAGEQVTGVAVIAVLSPDQRHATGFRRAPSSDQQPGCRRYFQQLAQASSPTRPWWDGELGDGYDGERFEAYEHQQFGGFAARQADEDTEHVLDQLEAEYDAKLWWYGSPGRRTKYPPAIGSVRELYAYARKQELDPEEFARCNRERQNAQWLQEQHERDRRRIRELDADQAEVATALHTPRRGRSYAADQDWLATEHTLRPRRALRYIYRDTAKQPQRPREA